MRAIKNCPSVVSGKIQQPRANSQSMTLFRNAGVDFSVSFSLHGSLRAFVLLCALKGVEMHVPPRAAIAAVADVCAPLACLFSVLAAAQIKTRGEHRAQVFITSRRRSTPSSEREESGSARFEGHVPSILTDSEVQ